MTCNALCLCGAWCPVGHDALFVVVAQRMAAKCTPPKGWRKLYDVVCSMRAAADAPVDSIGCDRLFDPKAPKSVQRYQILLSLMLSSQTRDQVTAAAMGRLKEAGCTPQQVMKLSEAKLAALLVPVSFYNNKAKYIKETTRRIVEEHAAEVPSDYQTLTSFPGLGPKMVHLFLQAADGKVEGIGVDTHVHRIARRFKWVPPSAKSPEDTRKALEGWMPRELWDKVNHLLVGLGQTVCLPRHPKCDMCPAASVCPNAFVECAKEQRRGSERDTAAAVEKRSKRDMEDICVALQCSSSVRKRPRGRSC